MNISKHIKTVQNQYFKIFILAAIVVVSIILHKEHLPKDLIGIHLWRQSQTQWNTLNFYRHDMNIFNPRTCTFDEHDNNISRFEFPIMQWFVALVMKIFGEDILVTRLSYFFIGILSVYGMYKILKLLTKHEFGSWMGAAAFCFSPLFFYYTINPLPDNMALMGGIWFLYYFLKFIRTSQFKNIYLSAVFLLLATLAKLPFIILSAGIGFYVLKYWRKKISYKIVGFYVWFLIPAIAWYVWVLPAHEDNGVFYGIFNNQVSLDEYSNILDYHKNIMFPDILMNEMSTYLFFAGILFTLLYKKYNDELFWILMFSTFGCIIYWLLELNMISNVHDYYMMPFLPFLYIVIGYCLVCLWRSNRILRIIAIVFLIASVNATYHSTKDLWSIEKSYVNSDIFIYQKELRKAVPDDALCFMAKDVCTFIYPYQFNKMGYDWVYDNYSGNDLKNLIQNKNVKYMYCDVRTIDTAADIKPYLKKLIMERGSVKVWELEAK